MAVKRLKPKRGTGEDNIPPYIFKGCVDFFVRPLAHIFNVSLKNSMFPIDLKKGVIIPVFKKGDKCNVVNYRPITLLNSLAKIFEVILYNDILKSVESKISKHQHGFLRDMSTITNLCTFTEHASAAIEGKKQLDVIYTDCEKAFDRVDHPTLLKILVNNFGFSEKSYNFMLTYLSNRPQRVRVGKSRSAYFCATSGVPQGSNLGPLLFILFINALPNVILNSTGLLFADDFKLFREIDTPEDCTRLQGDINLVAQWFSNHKMKLNIEKCAVMTYSRKQNVILYNYSINGEVVGRIDGVKDLGVHFQGNLKFNDHYQSIVSRAYKALGFIMRNSKNFKIDTIIRLYNAIVRPLLEYASCIWSPTSLTNIDQIERVQKRFTRYLYLRKYNTYPFRISYSALLVMFTVERLSNRRDVQDALFIFCIVNAFKYKSCDMINYVKFHVPKINLRMKSDKVFSVASVPSSSPMERMMLKCNQILKLELIAPDLFSGNYLEFIGCVRKILVS